MNAKDFEQAFDSGEDILEFLDVASAKRSMRAQKKVKIDFPAWMIESLDKEANRVGVTRQSIIKIWLAERLEEKAVRKVSPR